MGAGGTALTLALTLALRLQLPSQLPYIDHSLAPLPTPLPVWHSVPRQQVHPAPRKRRRQPPIRCGTALHDTPHFPPLPPLMRFSHMPCPAPYYCLPGFTMKLRKHVRSRRLSEMVQLGTDRVVAFGFGAGEGR